MRGEGTIERDAYKERKREREEGKYRKESLTLVKKALILDTDVPKVNKL